MNKLSPSWRSAGRIIAACSLSAFLYGCTLYSKPEVPAIKTPLKFKPKIHVTHARLNEKWWENFHDNQLNQLVAKAEKNNYSYLIAIKNIQIACTYVTQAVSALFPQANLNLESTRNKSATAILSNFSGGNTVNPTRSMSNIFNLQELTGSVSYQVDIWNQLGNAVRQAKASEKVSEADANVIKLTLISNVVNTYYQITTANANLANLRQQLWCANEIVKLTRTQQDSGLIDGSVLDNAKNQAEAIKSNISSLQKQKELLMYTLAYLVGEYPETFTLPAGHARPPQPHRDLLPPGIPAQMLANRPDIQDAYYQILAYGYAEKQSIANFLPSISLTGSYGYASPALSHLISPANVYWSYGLFASQFVFDYQNRLSIYQRTKYQYESAILNYKNTIMNAFNEVDSALVSYQKDNESMLSSQRQTVNSRNLADLARSLYQSGLNDYATYLGSDLTYLQSSYNLANQRLAVTQDIIQVYKTLGLGL